MEKTETTETASPTNRNIISQRVLGAGGRPRTIQMCEAGCWHGSYGQATKCKSAIAYAAKGEVHHWIAGV